MFRIVWLLAAMIVAAGGCAPRSHSTQEVARLQAEEASRYDCPAWAQEELPAWVSPYVGRFGLPEPYASQKELIGDVTAGIDLWQANHFIVYRPETAGYLYTSYTPTVVHYQKGSLPGYEAVVAEYTAGISEPRDKALALLTRALLERVQHPAIPPMCIDTAMNRGMDDEALLASGCGWCNEQARVFVRLCQVAGIPARMIFLFATPAGGHVVAEFHADGRWSMADSSWLCVFPAEDGHLMSAAECHGPGKQLAGRAYYRRYQEIIAYSDEQMVGGKFPPREDAEARRQQVTQKAQAVRRDYREQTPTDLTALLWAFGVLNYPLPM